MNIKPLSNHILIEPKAEEKTTVSGIIIPDTADKKKQTTGVVVAVGAGKMNDKGERKPIEVKPGDKVLFKEPWGEESKIKDGDKQYFLVEEDDVLAVVE